MPPLRVCYFVMISAALGGCASRPAAVATAVAPPVAMPTTSVAMPVGAHVGMTIPARLDDGGYATPNRNLSPAAAAWHLRNGLNFAALACRGPDAALIVARYNAVLQLHKPVLAEAERTLMAEYRATAGASWRDGYDDAMTRLYNYYALAPARAALCASAGRVLAEAVTVASPQFAGFAVARLPELDRSYTDFFAAYDAWRSQRTPMQPSYALSAASVPRGGAGWPPRIDVDPAVLRLP